MNIEAQQQHYRSGKPSSVGRGIERLTRPLSSAFAKAVPGGMVEKVIRGIDAAAGAAPAVQFDHDLADLEACRVAALRVEARAKAMNGATGLASGLGGMLTMGADIPATIALSLRNIRETGRAYGYFGEGTAERLFRLNILELASVDGGQARERRIADLEAGIAADGRLVERDPKLAAPLLDQATERLARTLVASLIRARAGSVVPILGSLFSGAVNLSFQGDVSEAARFGFQARRLRQADGPV